jgi:cytochrome d ubiquinol oxidase subunit II
LQREAISKAMGPVWEANHVWLIFFITGLFSAFPRAFAALSVALYLPATLALVGIVPRGAACSESSPWRSRRDPQRRPPAVAHGAG